MRLVRGIGLTRPRAAPAPTRRESRCAHCRGGNRGVEHAFTAEGGRNRRVGERVFDDSLCYDPQHHAPAADIGTLPDSPRVPVFDYSAIGDGFCDLRR
ncbi:hypothetical protein WI44_04245 [Burkholderia cepacia]|uniref:hypothetical protein n=1 Tax=Burkholderia cepacia TaxID=292 RepID=UPI0007529168|nr:hypothetical protein [Burkholderia cepacia]KVA25061.1 hypothetical protein WI44_04245 [Burkholderia cepacia]KVA45596.1 hypothetical protein WI45_12275 [Burkholderia cepacia]